MSGIRNIVAKAIWAKKPDAGGMNKSWPLDGKSPKEQRAFMHDPPASFELCFIYADAAIAALKSAPGWTAPQNSAERDPSVTPDYTGADTLQQTPGA